MIFITNKYKKNIIIMPKNKLQLEYNKAISQKEAMEKQLCLLPKGTIRMKTIGGREYAYLQYRDSGRIHSTYIKKSELAEIEKQIRKRDALKKKAREAEVLQKQYGQLLGIPFGYIPAKNVDYEEYTLFMSAVAHDYKRLSWNQFIKKYDTTKYRGINKRYLKGFIDYISGLRRNSARKSRELVLDPYTRMMYFQYGMKEVLEEELKKAIPAFLNYGLLITNVQEAVHGA